MTHYTSTVLPFAFCALPFDLLFGLERASQNANGPAGAGSKVKIGLFFLLRRFHA
jgi:hypothetical protein